MMGRIPLAISGAGISFQARFKCVPGVSIALIIPIYVSVAVSSKYPTKRCIDRGCIKYNIISVGVRIVWAAITTRRTNDDAPN